MTTVIITSYLAGGLMYLGYEVEKNKIQIGENIIPSICSVLFYPVFLLITIGRRLTKLV